MWINHADPIRWLSTLISRLITNRAQRGGHGIVCCSDRSIRLAEQLHTELLGSSVLHAWACCPECAMTPLPAPCPICHDNKSLDWATFHWRMEEEERNTLNTLTHISKNYTQKHRGMPHTLFLLHSGLMHCRGKWMTDKGAYCFLMADWDLQSHWYTIQVEKKSCRFKRSEGTCVTLSVLFLIKLTPAKTVITLKTKHVFINFEMANIYLSLSHCPFK